ncbi:MAG: DUF2332 domain-containing protein [Acidimicrobiia bacterium]|nr:DUF2332 domain-containing protein [Acidimicrobiia bacterium]
MGRQDAPSEIEDPELETVAQRYRRFARYEAHGVSATYEQWALGVAQDEGALRFLASLPIEKRQPNLLFAAVRYLFGTPGSADEFLGTLTEEPDQISSVMAERRVQTNEPARCATLLPALAQLPQPLALIEVGASAGLCLLPDHYNYRFGDVHLAATLGSPNEAPEFPCEVRGAVPVPEAMPQVAWRVGLDLHPVDLRSDDEVSWLRTLVWPEHDERSSRLDRAISVAVNDPPTVHQGDLLHDLAELVHEAPDDTHVVVFHSAVLSYLPSRRAIDDFVHQVGQLPVTWISNESPLVLSELAQVQGINAPKGSFLLTVDGRCVAFTGPHGQAIDHIA